MKKTVSFAKPPRLTDADSWVTSPRPSDGSEASQATDGKPIEPMKRFTIDVPESLHRRIKTACAQRGTRMADEIRDILNREFPAT